MTIAELITSAERRLKQAAVAEPRLEAQLLLAHVLDRPRVSLLTHSDLPISPVDCSLFAALIERRARREPYAYLVGTRHWRDLVLSVDRSVLIPRPETEILAALGIHAVQQHSSHGRRVVACDVGTGSGALAVALARACPSAQVYGIDSSSAALQTAARNALRWAPPNLGLLCGDLLSGVPEPVDVLVANLPYIPTADLSTLEPELYYEPSAALDGGEDGLDPIRRLLTTASEYLSRGAALLLECSHDQAARIRSLARDRWPDGAIQIHNDLAGIERFVEIQTR